MIHSCSSSFHVSRYFVKRNLDATDRKWRKTDLPSKEDWELNSSSMGGWLGEGDTRASEKDNRRNDEELGVRKKKSILHFLAYSAWFCSLHILPTSSLTTLTLLSLPDRSVREGLAHVRRQACGEEEDAGLQVQPEPDLQCGVRLWRSLGAD